MSNSRPSWDDYFLAMLEPIAARSTCLRHKIGALIAVDNEIVSTGYNGPPKGLKHCAELGGCLRDQQNIESGRDHQVCRAVHSEQNAILQAAFHGRSVRGGTLYCTHAPCVICAKMIINAGIRRVVFQHEYPDGLSKDILKEAGVDLVGCFIGVDL